MMFNSPHTAVEESPLQTIRSLLSNDLRAVDQVIISQLVSHIPLIKQMTEYILSAGGKRMRPMILLLCARALSSEKNAAIQLSAVIELIHTATLLHDDVVDHSTLRRGHQTAHVIWGSASSVLVGDYLYSRAFQIVVDMHHQTILDEFAKATHYIAEGEILQLVNCHNPDTTEAFYFDIIQRKTAKLFEIAAVLPALLDQKTQDCILPLQTFGKHIGLAYQLTDDALDYSHSSEQIGKNIGQDLLEGKPTLPLIYAMHQCEKDVLPLLQEAIRQGVNDHLDDIVRTIESTHAIQYTLSLANDHAGYAKEALADLPPSSYRDTLYALCDFVVNRTY